MNFEKSQFRTIPNLNVQGVLFFKFTMEQK